MIIYEKSKTKCPFCKKFHMVRIETVESHFNYLDENLIINTERIYFHDNLDNKLLNVGEKIK